MAYGNNRAGQQGRAIFRAAGGSVIKFRHPYLAGQVDTNGSVDEIDISASCKLEGRYFQAMQSMDSSKQVVLVNKDVVTITNNLLNGTITMPVIEGSGLVGEGDFLAALRLIKSIGDTVGGLITKTDFINGRARTRIYYGVTPKTVPDDISEGNDVPVNEVQLYYAGYVEAVSSSTEINKKNIWAVGNRKGLSAYFAPYITQDGSTGENPVNVDNSGIPASSITDQIDTSNLDTQDGENEKKVLAGTWTSGDRPVVSGATPIEGEVTDAGNEGVAQP